MQEEAVKVGTTVYTWSRQVFAMVQEKTRVGRTTAVRTARLVASEGVRFMPFLVIACAAIILCVAAVPLVGLTKEVFKPGPSPPGPFSSLGLPGDGEAPSDRRHGRTMQRGATGQVGLECSAQPMQRSSPVSNPFLVPSSKLDSPKGEAHFCAPLIVPQNCECILAVPTWPVRDEPFEITDMTGNVVLSVTRAEAPAAAQAARRPVGSSRLVLRSAEGDVLAQCMTAGPVGEHSEFHLLRSAGDYFAKLRRCEGDHHWQLSTLSGGQLHFNGVFDNWAVNVMSQEGMLVATTEACPAKVGYGGPCYRLRVSQQTDVGLILCSMLCIGHLEKS